MAEIGPNGNNYATTLNLGTRLWTDSDGNRWSDLMGLLWASIDEVRAGQPVPSAIYEALWARAVTGYQREYLNLDFGMGLIQLSAQRPPARGEIERRMRASLAQLPRELLSLMVTLTNRLLNIEVRLD